MRLVRAAVLRLLGTLAGAVLVVWACTVATEVRLLPLLPTAYVTDRHGAFLFQAGNESRRADGGRQVEYGYWPGPPPDLVVRATLALEDRRFFSHPGVDPAATLRAVWQHLVTGGGSGASTVAMQVVRMQRPRPRTLWAKAVEAGAAVGITVLHGRQAVLAQYLRLAPYGEGSHGIAHAARWYFDRPAAALSPAQAAMLSAVPQAPGLLSLREPGRRPHRAGWGIERTRARARRALQAMDLPAPELDAALRELDGLRARPAPRRPAEDLLTVLRLQRRVTPGDGPVLRAALDMETQGWVRRLAAGHLLRWRADGAQQVAVAVVRRRDRAVLAEVGALGGGIDFARTFRSPGSTLKPFLYALALDRALLGPDDVVADLPEGSGGINNADHDFLGPLLPRQALANSRNVPATNLLRRIGLGPAFGFLRRLGLHDGEAAPERYGLGLAIGALPTTLERLMRAYAALADDGVDRGLAFFTGSAEMPQRVMPLEAARLVGRFLSDPLARLPSFPRYGSSEFPFAVALKTGTSQGYRDAWTLEWSRDYVVGVWVGRADAGPMTRLSGARAAAGLAQAVMLRLHGAGRTDLVAGELPAPPGRVETELCAQTGRPAGDGGSDGAAGCEARMPEWVRPETAATADRVARGPESRPATRLAIVRPDNDTHVWRNPDVPPRLNRMVLRAAVEPAVPQVAWLVDGEVVAVGPPEEPLVWTMRPGRHRFQVRLPLAGEASRPVVVVVE